jgi:hypothetical protein
MLRPDDQSPVSRVPAKWRIPVSSAGGSASGPVGGPATAALRTRS